MVKDNGNMCVSYNNLKYRDRFFVDCYLNETLKESTTNINTFCNKLLSYIFAYSRENDFKECVSVEYIVYNPACECYQKNDYYIDGCKININITNAKKYMSLSANATRVYNKCKVAINDLRTQMYDSEDKSKVLELKDAIYNSSINAKEFKDRNENRKMAMKMFGLDQVKVDLTPNIYDMSGKNILANIKGSAEMDRDDAPIIPNSLEDITNED